MTRRSLLLSALAPGAPAPPVTRVDVYPVVYPVTGYFKFFTRPERPAVFVKVTCEDGTAGWGESVPLQTWSYETLESVTHTLRHYLGPALIGKNPLDLAAAHALMNKTIAPSFSTGMPIAKAGLDLALHDIAGKLAGKSLPQLWGREPLARIPLSWTVNVKTIAEAESLLEEGRRLGYRHVNIKVAPDAKFDLELVKAVRRFDAKCFLWADANGGYDLETALWVMPRLRDLGVNVMEQPVAANQLTALAAIRKQGALPVVLDEGLVNVRDLEEFHKLGCLDGAAMKPARTAGLFDARRQVEYLERHGLMFLGSGLTDPDVSLAASLHLYGTYHLKYPAALNGPQFLAGSFLKKPLAVKEGALALPTGPGLGVEPEEEKIRSASHD